jgi:3',5'-cyclic-AMP phosphodiesterase
MHHPPFESGIAWLDGSARQQWMTKFAEAIARHGQIRAIISGHLHRNIHAVSNGVSMTVCASTAPLVALDLRPLDPAVPDSRAMVTDEPPCYALHRWDGERLVSHFESVGDHRVLARSGASTMSARGAADGGQAMSVVNLRPAQPTSTRPMKNS